MKNQALMYLLASARSVIDAAMMLLDEEPQAEPAPVEQGCQHPPARRKSVATMGKTDAWMCRDCSHIHEGETANG